MPGERITRAKRIAVALAVGGLLLTVAVPAGAQSYREREQQIEDLIRAKKSRLSSLNNQASSISDQISASDQRLATIQRTLDALSAKLADARSALSKIEAKLDAAAAALHAKTAELEVILGELSAAQNILNARVATIYMNAPTAYSQALASAKDFADIVAANEFAGSVVRADQDAIDKLEEAKLHLWVQRNRISADQAELADQRNAAAAQAKKIAALVGQQASVRDQQATERANQRYLLSQVNHQRQQYINAINELQAESDAITAMLRGLQAGQRVVQGRGGYLKWPVSGPITSPFGWRIHPIYHYRSFHTGIDIGVSSGTIVKSARYGKVIYTGYNGAYGLIVMIDHGGQLATIYAHLSRVFVRTGQRVGTLQSIAASGNTGWSTGPHLHFEVRSQGQPVNPIRWL